MYVDYMGPNLAAVQEWQIAIRKRFCDVSGTLCLCNKRAPKSSRPSYFGGKLISAVNRTLDLLLVDSPLGTLCAICARNPTLSRKLPRGCLQGAKRSCRWISLPLHFGKHSGKKGSFWKAILLLEKGASHTMFVGPCFFGPYLASTKVISPRIFPNVESG